MFLILVSFEIWPSFTFLGSFVPLLCLIACYVPPQDSDSHHLLSHTLLWWPWPTPFGQATHRFVRGICRNLYLYCVVSWPHIGAAKWNFWMVKSLTLPQLAATWVCILSIWGNIPSNLSIGEKTYYDFDGVPWTWRAYCLMQPVICWWDL